MSNNNAFYVGIAECGCIRAMLVDDDQTTPDEIASFAKRQKKMKMRMAHRTYLSEDDVKSVMFGCRDHTPP